MQTSKQLLLVWLTIPIDWVAKRAHIDNVSCHNKWQGLNKLYVFVMWLWQLYVQEGQSVKQCYDEVACPSSTYCMLCKIYVHERAKRKHTGLYWIGFHTDVKGYNPNWLIITGTIKWSSEKAGCCCPLVEVCHTNFIETPNTGVRNALLFKQILCIALCFFTNGRFLFFSWWYRQ